MAVVSVITANANGVPGYGMQFWQRQHGLPENTVKALYQTRDGYLWIGTYSGLARFDGLKFTVFNHVNLPGLPSDVCKALVEDGEGNLWIGTDNGLVCWQDQTVKVYTTKDGLSGNDIRLLCIGHQNRLWIATSQGLDRFSEGRFTRLNARDGLSLDFVASMYEDPSGALWVSTTRGVERWDPVSARFKDCVNYATTETDHPRPGLWSNCQLSGRDGTVWLGSVHSPGSNSDGLALLGCTNEPAVLTSNLLFATPAMLFIYTNTPGIVNGPIQSMVPDRQGDLWLVTERNGLLRFRNGRFAHFDKSDGLPDVWGLSMLEDREGNLWIGTRSGGLNRLQPQSFQVFTMDNGLPHDKAWTMCESKDGSVWLGTDGGVTHWLDGCITNYIEQHGLSFPAVRSLHEDNEGTLWIGTSWRLFSLHDGKLTSHRPIADREDYRIRVITGDRTGNLWIGWDKGLMRFSQGRWQNFTTNDWLSCNDVRAVLEDRHGALWLGTFGGGLNRWQDGKVTVLTTKDGLASDFAWTLHEDADGVLWIGTEGGLNRYENGRLTTYTTREGLFDNLINQILEDDRGYLWLSCDRGIFRVSKQELNDVAQGKTRSVHSVAYGEADGLISVETNGRKSQPAGCKTRDGRLWFPTGKGVVVMDPSKLDYEEIPPPVVIEEVQANGQLIFSNSRVASSLAENPVAADVSQLHYPKNQSGLTSAATALKGSPKSEIHLPPGGAHLLAFHYTANSLAAPEKVRFKYRLLGSHSDWIEAGTRRVAHYTDLSPGHYRYQVIAANQHGVWNQTGASMAFYLAPFFYQTWWFYAICALGVVVAAFAAHRVRVGVVQRLEDLEKAKALADARLNIARDLHEKLGAKLTHLALLGDSLQPQIDSLAAAATHESVAAMARDSVGDLGDLVWAVDPRCDSLESFAAYIIQSVEEYCEQNNISCSFDIPKQLPDVPLSTETRHALLLTVKEVLRGIADSGVATNLALRIATEAAAIVIVIESRHGGAETSPVALENSQITAATRRVRAIGGSFEVECSGVGARRITIRTAIERP